MSQSQSVRLMGFSYVSGKTGNLVCGMTIVPADRFPAYEWYKTQCKAFVAAHKALGSDTLLAVLRHFAEGTILDKSIAHRYGKYQGHDLITLAPGKSKKEGVTFGKAKAKALVAIIEQCGMEDFVDGCQAIIDGKAPSGPATASAKRKVESINPAPQTAPVTSQAPSRPIPTDVADLVAAWGAKGHVVVA